MNKKNSCPFISLFIFHFSLFTFIALICLPAALGQNNTGAIQGQIIDRKKGQPLAQQQVILKIHRGEEVEQHETTTDDNGAYLFDKLPIAFDVYYTITTTYDGKTYTEEDIVLSAYVSSVKVNIEIGAFTDDPAMVKVHQHHLFIVPPPEGHSQAVSVIEFIKVENTSELPFQTQLDGQTTGLHFNLPNGYEELQIDQIFKQAFADAGQKVVSNQPLAPADSNSGFSYVIHFDESGLDLSRVLTFDTEQLFVFISDGLPLLSQSRILGASRREQIHEQFYTVYATDVAKPLSAGQTADLRFRKGTNTPASGDRTAPTSAPSNPLMIGLIAVAAACAGGFLVAAIFKLQSAKTQPAEPQAPQAAPDASWLGKLDTADLERARIARLEIITRLEELYEKREISERVYNRLRKEQADRLATVLERLRQ